MSILYLISTIRYLLTTSLYFCTNCIKAIEYAFIPTLRKETSNFNNELEDNLYFNLKHKSHK